MAKLKRQIPKREIRSVMQAEITRNTRTKVMRHRGRNTPKWKGLPKPRAKSDFTPLDVVTEGVVSAVGKVVGGQLQWKQREFRIKDRQAVISYLRGRNSND